MIVLSREKICWKWLKFWFGLVTKLRLLGIESTRFVFREGEGRKGE